MTNQLSDFKEFMKRCKPATLSFLTENQDDFDVAEPCVLQLSFTNMLIHENPNVIYLTGGASSMRLDRVKSVEFSEKATPIGALIRVHCKNPNARSGESVYTIVAS
jgi:hypothetical protein|nr:MAG TPA: hypothetical protein [Caudoviricetes sp.]